MLLSSLNDNVYSPGSCAEQLLRGLVYSKKGENEDNTEKIRRGRVERKKEKCPLDRNRAGDLSVSINSFTAERDSQLHHKGIWFVWWI